MIRTKLSIVSMCLMTCFIHCIPESSMECIVSQDCALGRFCRAGICESIYQPDPFYVYDDQAPYTGMHEQQAHDALQTDVTNNILEEQSDCPQANPPLPGDLILHEILVNVPSGPQGDANQDGVRHAHDDEFVELLNLSGRVLSLRGISLANDTTTRFTFPDFCLEPDHAVVVFGGIEPDATLPSGPGFTSLVAHSRFAFSNSQGTFVARDSAGQELIRFSYERSPAQSYQMLVDASGQHHYVLHQEVAPGTLFSPGYCANGKPFTQGCYTSIFEEDEQESINEQYLADDS